jgi:transcriptional regulator with XRE-family HTH domain
MTIRELANRVRGRRLEFGLTQAEVARRAHVSRKWLVEFESGKPTAELLPLLRVLDALDLSLSIRAREPAPNAASVDLDRLLEATGDR